jgi:hypothetical protein
MFANEYLLQKALQERDFAYLTDLIRNNAEMSPETRAKLADMILGLLARKIKFPKHRPAKEATQRKNEAIGRRVFELVEKEGWGKIAAAVKQTATEFDLFE